MIAPGRRWSGPDCASKMKEEGVEGKNDAEGLEDEEGDGYRHYKLTTERERAATTGGLKVRYSP